MLPLKLTINNFMSYKNLTQLDFSSFDLACLCGDNGSGKSALLEAITWVLWNKARTMPDALIHQGESSMWVDFEFQHGNKRYRVFRKRNKKGRGSSELDFLVYDNQWVSLSGATIKDTEQRITEIIKLPYEIFINSAYLKQGHADEFTTKSPAQRKEILGKILDLDYYELLSQKAREKIRSKETEAELLVKSIFEIKENLNQKELFQNELKEAQKIVAERDKELKAEKEKLEKMQKDKNRYDLIASQLENNRQRIKSLAEEGRQLKEEWQRLNKKIETIKRLLKNKINIEKGVAELEKAKKKNEDYNERLVLFLSYQEKLGGLKAKREEINERIEKIKRIDKCPTCLRELSKKEAEKIINSLKEQLNKEVTVVLEKIKEKIAKIDYDKEKHQQVKKMINSLSHFEEEKKQLDLESKLLNEKKELLFQVKNKLMTKSKEYINYEKQNSELEEKLKELKPLEKQFEQQRERVNQFLEELLEAKEKYGALSQRLSDLQAQEELYKAKKERLQGVKKETAVYKQLAEIFSKKGVQALIIERILPEIEMEANRLLEKITQGKMQLRFITSKEKKSKEGEVETLEIKIADGLGERDYEVYSGGEAFRIDLAVRVALSKVLAKHAGTKLQFLVIDEGFGSLDETGKDEVIEAVSALKSDFKKVLVVTHIQELKNLFPIRIEITKTKEGSRLELVGV